MFSLSFFLSFCRVFPVCVASLFLLHCLTLTAKTSIVLLLVDLPGRGKKVGCLLPVRFPPEKRSSRSFCVDQLVGSPSLLGRSSASLYCHLTLKKKTGGRTNRERRRRRRRLLQNIMYTRIERDERDKKHISVMNVTSQCFLDTR